MSPDGEGPEGNPFDRFDDAPKPVDPQAEGAREARESAGRVPRRRAQTQETAAPAKPAAEGGNIFDQFDKAPGDDGVALMERLRLNRQDAFYRSSVAGSSRLALLASLYKSPDTPDMTPEMKAVRKGMRDEYIKVVADLAAHDEMQPWGTSMEAMAALGGQLEGTMISPEAWVGWGAKGVNWAWRTAKAGFQQAGIQAVTDPVVQGLNMQSGVQQEYDPLRTVASGVMGFGIGAGAHAAGEGLSKLVGQHQLRKQLFDLGTEDAAFDAPRHALWALDPANGIVQPERAPLEPLAEKPAPKPTGKPPVPAGLDDALAAFVDMQIADGGGISIHSFTPSEVATLRGAGLVEEFTTAEGVKYEGVDPESLWPLRQQRQQEIADARTAARRPPERPPEHGFEDTVAAEQERLGPETPPEEAAHAAFEQEVGPGLRSLMDEQALPPEKFDEIRSHYNRQEGESVETAMQRSIDDWVTAQEREMDAVAAADPELRADLEAAAPPASKEMPPEDWTPAPDQLDEARRLTRGWSARAAEGPKPQSLLSFVRKNGGLLKDQPEVPDLLAQDIGRQPGLLRTKEGGGRGYDDMAEKARDAGYDIGPDLDIGNGVNAQRFMEMLIEDASGRQKHYPAGVDTEGHFETQRYNDDTIEHLKNVLGVDPKGKDPRQIAWLLLMERDHERAGGRISEQGGGVPEGGRAQPGEADRIAGDGEGAATGGDRGGERGAEGGGAGGRAGPETGQGERVAALERDAVLGPTHRAVKDLGSLPDIARDWARDPVAFETRFDTVREQVRIAEGEIAQKYGVPRRKLPEIEDRVTPAESEFLYYSEAPTSLESLDDIRKQLSPVDSLQEAAREIYVELKRLPRDPGRLTASDQLVLLRLQVLSAEIKRLGGDLREVMKESFQQYGARYLPDANDAVYMVEQAAKDLDRLHKAGFRIEPGAEGKPQTLLPGVEPVTDRQRIEAQMEKSLRGGDRPPPEGGLFDEGARAQGDLLDAPSGRAIPDDTQGIAQRKKGGKMAGEPTRQPVERPETPSPEKDLAIRSLQQQSTDLAKALDFPLRQGRVRSPRHAGEFSPRSGVSRVREIPDFDVVSHEMTHALETRIGQDLTDLTKAHATELRALDYDQTAKGRRVNEGFAEFGRLLLTNPLYAERAAPTFALEFRAFMQAREPALLAKLDEAAKAYKAYLDAPSVDAVSSVVRSVHEDPTFIQKTAKALTAAELPNTIKSVVGKVYETMWDDKAPFHDFVREMGRAIRDREGKPVALSPADNPEILMRLAERSRQAATLNLQYGVRGYHETHTEGPALTDALAEALGKPSWWGKYNEGARKDFSAYLVARRSEYLWGKFEAGEIPNPPVAFSKADAVQAMADLDAAHGDRFRNASDMVHAYNRQLLKKAHDGGLITTDLFDKLSEDEFYVPFMRDVSDKPVSGTGMGQGAEGPGTTEVVRKLRGSARDIIDPLESIMGQTFLVERTLAHNDIVKAMVDLSRRAGPAGGKYVEAIPANELRMHVADLEQAIENRAKAIGMDVDEARQMIAALGGLEGDAVKGNYFSMERTAAHGEPIVFYREGGEVKAVRVMSKEEGLPLYELLTAAPPAVTDIWANLVSSAAAIKRSSIISNPTFMLTNYIRDQVAASLLRPDYVPFVGGTRGMIDEWRQGNNAILYAYAGGVAGGRAIGVVDKAVERDINALSRKGYSVTRVPTLKEMMELASFTEAGTRNSVFATVYEASMRKGLSSYEAMIEAAFQAQDLLDFSRHGSATLWVRKFLPFFNAHIQGLDKARRTMIEPIVNRLRDGQVFERDTADFNNALLTWTKVGGAGMALGAVYAAVMSENEAYRDANPYFKGTHFVVPFGNKIFVVPKPFELGLGFTMGEYGFHALAEKDPRAMRMLREAAWDILAPPDPIADMPIVTPALELGLGKSWFTKRDIVPEQIQRLPTAQQFTDRTSELGKWIGQTIGVSPIKVDYAIASQFATWGRDVMAASQGVTENTPAASLDDAVFFRRFVKDPTRSSDITTRFWDFMGRTTGRFNQDVAGYNDLVKDAVTRGAPMTAANDFLAKLPAAERAFVTLKSAAKETGKPAFTADERRLHPLQHAYDAAELLNGLRKELGSNSQMGFGGREKIELNPVQRRDLLENVRELSQMEMRNALVIVGEGGFANRPVLDPSDTMAKIAAISPAVAEEIRTRYATAKIFSTEAVRRSWPQLKTELVRNGTDADIRGLALDAKAEGYQFAGTRAKRPGIIRRPIAGSPAVVGP